MIVGIWPKLMVICLGVLVTLSLCEQADARKKRKRFISPVKVEEVATSPHPFIIGKSPLTFSMMVKVPLSAIESKVLEVSTLITSPTRRTMSFVSQRLSLAEATQGGVLRLVPVELVWDGKDQYGRLVADGSYFYEIQAKLMEDKGNGPRTKIVSHRIQGTLEALAYVGEVLSPLPPEPEIPAEVEALQQEVLATDDLLLIEAEVKVEDESSVAQEKLVSDEGDSALVESDENESVRQSMSGNVESVESEGEAEVVSEESYAEVLPSSGAKTVLPDTEQTSILATEQPLIQPPAEPSLSSEGDSLLH